MNASFDDLLAHCITASESGTFDLEAVIASHPQYADELREFFANRAWIGTSDPLPPADLCGRILGDYRLIGVIGRGGMGVVYRAVQISLGRDVAVKVIAAGSLADGEMRRRFQTEAVAAASTDHPGIVPIIEVGHHHGLDFFAMRLIEGPTLCDLLGPAKTSPSRAATIIRDAARAVGAAHRRGVIHRDIKPDNIMIDDGGQIVVMDFGLARVTDDASVTRSGQILGTPHYMSPQQASGVVNVDHRTDIYSLGAVLYALLTGRPPHGDDAGAAEALRRVLQDDLAPVQTVVRGVPTPLAKICHAAMHYNPEARYQTAAELADDLERFERGESIAASESGMVRWMIDEIDRDAHHGHFAAWSNVLRDLGLIIAAAHATIFLLRMTAIWPPAAYWIPRFVMLALIALRIARARSGSLWPHAAAERPVWAIWIGYMTALGCINLLTLFGYLDNALMFPISSVLSAFGFVAMAGTVWGGSGLIGLGFVLTTVLTIVFPPVSPLIFGAAWLIAMLVLSWHYKDTISGTS